jgi:hypothetical protein
MTAPLSPATPETVAPFGGSARRVTFGSLFTGVGGRG